MPKLIKDAQVISNNWHLVEADTGIDEVLSLNADKLLIPVNLWLEHKAQLKETGAEFGLWFDSSQSPDLLDEDANNFPLIALNYPSFRDGRAYSYAAILRQQAKYEGDLCAIGEILRDQLSYMLSCGFSSFLVPDDADEALLLSGFHDFSENYQSTVLKPVPLFRRR
tara:strand:+ start:73098 stop:73598 length:501 start_codon:yes stop_codon:yes gene_type:complete